MALRATWMWWWTWSTSHWGTCGDLARCRCPRGAAKHGAAQFSQRTHNSRAHAAAGVRRPARCPPENCLCMHACTSHLVAVFIGAAATGLCLDHDLAHCGEPCSCQAHQAPPPCFVPSLPPSLSPCSSLLPAAGPPGPGPCSNKDLASKDHLEDVRRNVMVVGELIDILSGEQKYLHRKLERHIKTVVSSSTRSWGAAQPGHDARRLHI